MRIELPIRNSVLRSIALRLCKNMVVL